MWLWIRENKISINDRHQRNPLAPPELILTKSTPGLSWVISSVTRNCIEWRRGWDCHFISFRCCRFTPAASSRCSEVEPWFSSHQKEINSNGVENWSNAPPCLRSGGGGGIRTHGTLRYGAFQDRCLKPDSTTPPDGCWYSSPSRQIRLLDLRLFQVSEGKYQGLLSLPLAVPRS